MRLSSVLVASSSFIILNTASHAALIFSTYIGPDGGSWNTAGNWSRAGVPNNGGGNTYEVFIDSTAANKTVNLNISPTIDKLTVDAGDGFIIGNNTTLTMALGPILNNGLITLNSSGNATNLNIGANMTSLTGSGTLVMSAGQFQNRISGAAFDITLVNGATHTIRGSGQIGLNVIELINDGLIQADNPTAPLQFDLRNGTADNFNNGTLEALNGATMTIGSSSLDNTLGLIRAQTGSLIDLNGSTLVGGEYSTSGTGLVRVTGTTTLTNAANTGDISVLNNVTLSINGTLANDDLVTLNSIGNATNLAIGTNPTTLGGTGEVVMGGNFQNRITGNFFDITMVNDEDHTIRGSGQIGLDVIELINDGLIQADNPTAPLQFDLRNGTADNFNNSAIESLNGATITFINSNIDNSLGVIRAGDASFVDLTGTTIVGGELATDGSGLVRVTGTTTLTNLTNTGDISVLNNVTLNVNGTLTNDDLVTLNSTGNATNLHIGTNPTTIAGTGEVVMGGNFQNRISGNAFDITLVNDEDHTIRGSGQIGLNVIELINDGLIQADNPAATLQFDLRNGTADNFNNSMMESLNGATMTFVNSDLDNSLGVIRAADTSFVDLTGSTILGGELATDGSGLVRVTGTTTLTNLTNTGDISVLNNVTLNVNGTLTNDGQVSLNSIGNVTSLNIGTNPTTLGGTGELVMGDNVQNRISGNVFDIDLVNAAGHTIRGSGQIGLNVIDILNQGSIIADSSVGLSIDQRNFMDNQGLLHASGGNMAILAGPFTTSGTVTIDATRTLTRSGDYTQTAGVTTTNGTLSVVGNSAVHLNGGVLNGAGSVFAGAGVNNNAGTVAPGNSAGTLSITGNYTQQTTATLAVELGGTFGGTQYDVLSVSGNAVLAGTLDVSTINGFTPAPGDVFTILVTAGTRTGTFCTILPKNSYEAIYSNNSVAIRVTNGCPGDITENGVVNVDDLLMVINGWGNCPEGCLTCAADIAPAKGNGVVNVDDLLLVINAWGTCP